MDCVQDTGLAPSIYRSVARELDAGSKHFPAPRTRQGDLRGSLTAIRIREGMARFLDDVSSSIDARPCEAQHDPTRSLGHLQAPIGDWHSSGKRHSTDGRHSSDWETETLLDPNRSSLDLERASYSCPFRKRNPVKFNIRDYGSCASAPFDSIVGLKHHILSAHRRKPMAPQCRRCKTVFKTEMALEEHFLLPRDQMCDVNPSPYDDPEDGITESMGRVLAADHASGGIWTWDEVWRLVFPVDVEVPEPDFQPVVELVEVEHAFDECQDTLKSSIREKLGLLLTNMIDADYLNFLVGQLELVFETHRVDIMKQAQNRCVSTGSRAPMLSDEQEPSHPPKRANRRSRRSTLLQSTQRPVTTPFRYSNSQAIGDTRNTQTAGERASLRHTEPRPRTRISVGQHAQTFAAAQPPPATQAYEPAGTARDPRDSGISMPCDTCDAEPCTCAETTSTTQHTQRGHPEPDENGQQRPKKLSIQTLNLGANTLRSEVGDADGSTTGGRFSPESFKQRVLRKQFLSG